MELLREGNWSSYKIGTRPTFAEAGIPVIETHEPQEPLHIQRERASHT